MSEMTFPVNLLAGAKQTHTNDTKNLYSHARKLLTYAQTKARFFHRQLN